MFRKKFGAKRRWPWRARSSKIPASKIPRSIARVRRDWVSVYNVTDSFDNTGCRYVIAPWNPVTIGGLGAQCFSSFSLNVMFAQALTDLYGDDVKIVKMVGDLWLRPVFVAADACFPDQVQDLQTAWANYFIRLRGGLFKQRIVSSDLAVEGVVPHPLQSRDWSDAGFLKTFERTWVPPGEWIGANVYGEGQVVGAIGNTHQAGYTVPEEANGDQQPYNVPALSTDCFFCTVGNESCVEGPTQIRYVAPGWKRVNWSSRKVVHMREDDNLTWYFDWAQLSPSQGDCGIPTPVDPPCAMHIVPSLKIQLQYG